MEAKIQRVVLEAYTALWLSATAWSRVWKKWNIAGAKIRELNYNARSHWCESLNRGFQAVNASRPRRITRPLRAAFDSMLRVRLMFSGFLQTIKRGITGLLHPALAFLICLALAHPTLKDWALNWVRRFPVLESRLYIFALASGIISSGVTMQISFEVPDKPSRLTPRARRIYADLNAAIKDHNKRS